MHGESNVRSRLSRKCFCSSKIVRRRRPCKQWSETFFYRIAQGVARAATALGMEVDAHSPRADAAVAAALGVRLHASPEDLFAACTHVSVHCALTERTAALVDASMLARMPQAAADGTPCGAHLINMARARPS